MSFRLKTLIAFNACIDINFDIEDIKIGNFGEWLMPLNENYRVLITEDNEAAALNLRKVLEMRGHKVSHANSSDAAKTLIEQSDFDIAFVDLDLEKPRKGYDLLPLLAYKGAYPVVLSGHTEDEYIEQGYESSCKDYLVKPFTKDKLDRIFSNFSELDSVKNFRKIVQDEFHTVDEDTISQLRKIEDNLTSSSSFYITGPTGTGKTILSRAIHRSKHSNLKNYVHVNCAAIPKDLIESELFGTRKGAFTGSSEKLGKLAEADQGTLHLDEVGAMPKALQEKLLLALDDGFIIPVGGNNQHKVKTKFQLVSSTCESLEEKVSQGIFREDLFYRLMGTHIHLKPLRERRSDINFLVNKMIDSLKLDRGFVVKGDAKNALLKYNWFGNVRELIKFFDSKREMFKPILRLDDLPDYIRNNFNRFIKTDLDLITEGQLALIEDISYPLFKFRQETEVVRHFFKKCSYNKKQTRILLGNMTQYTFDKHIKIIEAERDEG